MKVAAACGAGRSRPSVQPDASGSDVKRPPFFAPSICRAAMAMRVPSRYSHGRRAAKAQASMPQRRSEEHTSELQSLMRISYAVFCLKKKNIKQEAHRHNEKVRHIGLATH